MHRLSNARPSDNKTMRRNADMRAFMLRIGFSVALMTTSGLTALPGYAAEGAAPPTLVVANPSPGDMLTPGALVMQGVAFDTVATEGIGVDRVSVFIGERDYGGAYLGDAALGKT